MYSLPFRFFFLSPSVCSLQTKLTVSGPISAYQFTICTIQNDNWTSSICIKFEKNVLYLNPAKAANDSWYSTSVDRSNRPWRPPVELVAPSSHPPCLPIAPNAVLSAEWRLLDGAHEAIDWMWSGMVESTWRWLGPPPGRSCPSIDQWGQRGGYQMLGVAAWRPHSLGRQRGEERRRWHLGHDVELSRTFGMWARGDAPWDAATTNIPPRDVGPKHV
jgi:hypothetical protein